MSEEVTVERTQPVDSRMCPIKQNTPYQASYWCQTDDCSWWMSGAKMCAIELIGRQVEREIINARTEAEEECDE